MRGDFSRFAFRPESSFSAVRMQQGRVLLDADWNEAIDIDERRRRAMLVDVVGRCAVSPLTPSAFRITGVGDSFSISPGRIYVDGLLAECFGRGDRTVDPVLGETRASDPIPYEQQPFLPEPPPISKTGGLVNLDVWERAVTPAEDPNLVDQALGTDTTVRVQTVWQVKILPYVEDPHHDLDRLDPPAGWMSSRPVSGGYRGSENRLYRIEIHDRGPVGQATFKWSQDNGSTAAAVTGVGRDLRTLTLRFPSEGTSLERGDLLELLDERHELGQRPGVVARVEDRRPSTAVLTEPLPPGALDPRFRPRARRWDAIAASARTWLELDDGIELRLGGATFRTGDYWTFSARSADRTVDRIREAPPQGIHHHRCALALISADGSVRDLRPRPSKRPVRDPR